MKKFDRWDCWDYVLFGMVAVNTGMIIMLILFSQGKSIFVICGYLVVLTGGLLIGRNLMGKD